MRISPRPYQAEAIKTICGEYKAGTTRQLLSLPTGCHAAGTEILMYDGGVKLVEDVQKGDLLMGPDSKPREVLNLISGTGKMYRITPTKGESFVVNEDHILSLEKTNERTDPTRISPSSGRCIINISVTEYLHTSKHFKHLHKLYRRGVNFPDRTEDLPIDAYFLGVLLGDGGFSNGAIIVTTPDIEIVQECYRQAETHGLIIRQEIMEGNKACNYYFVQPEGKRAAKHSHPIREALRDLELLGKKCDGKFIPDRYKNGSLYTRLDILAGLLDTDGHCVRGTGFEFSSKSLQLARDVVFVARSVGLAAYRTVKIVNGQEYQRVSISGDCSWIPTKIERKKAALRQQIKSHLVTGFTVEPIGISNYYGFQLDSDHLYLMGDFTVTHNSGKTVVFGMLAEELKVPTLVLAHREELLTQAKQKIRMINPVADVGILQASNLDGLYSQICVASVQTARQPHRMAALKRRGFKLVIVDEAHHVTAANTYGMILKELGVMEENNDKLLVGVTATAFRGDGIALGGVFDKITYERTILAMIRGGYLCDARGRSVKTMADLSGIHTKAGDFATAELSLAVNTEERNDIIVKSYLQFAEGRKAIVFCVDIKHSQDMAEAFQRAGINATAVWGAMDGRQDVLRDYAEGRLQVVCNCNVLTEGFDDPSTSAVLLARPTKSRVLYIQMVGRGLRLSPGKADCLVLDFADTAGRHDLCSLASLTGANAKFKVKNNQTLLEAVEEVEASDVWKKERIGKVSSEEVELFERSKFVWTPTGKGHYVLRISDNEELWIRKIADEYVPFALKKGEEKAAALSEMKLSLGYAQGVAEDYARLNARNMKLIDRSAKWRKNAATQKQLDQLKKWNVPTHDGITCGEASELIGIEVARRTEKHNGPATPKQLYHIRAKLGIPVTSDLTFAEARRIIAEANSKEKVAV